MRVETSIVVRSFNEARHLPRLIEGIRSQGYRDYETILVDSGSVDGTLDIARDSFDQVLQIDSHDFTFGYSLNRGIAAAKGRFVAIVSAHTYPADEGWLEALVAPLADDEVALTYGRQLPVPETKPSEAREFEELFGTERRVQRAPEYYCNNANAAIRRELWEQHPYEESLTGVEDQAWAKHWLDRGRVIVYEPAAAIHHIHEETWSQIERRYYREAVARRRIGLDRRRRLPAEVATGIRRLAGDVRAAGTDIGAQAAATRYRYRQTKGTLRGLVHDYDPQTEHQELFFDRGNEAVVIRSPGDAQLVKVPMPDVKPNDVLIRVAYVGVCATDLEVLEGSLGYYKSGRARYPIVPGHEYSGTVAMKGANVDSALRIGAKVVGGVIIGCSTCESCRTGNVVGCERRREVGVMNHDGAYARFVVVPAQHVHSLDPGADLPAHTLVEPLAVVTKGLDRLLTGLGGDPPSAAVVGAGPIGNLAAQALRARGHKVTVFDPVESRLAALPDGIDREPRLDRLDRFRVVVEATGVQSALEQVLTGAAAGARVLLLGLPYGELNVDFESVVANDRAVVGSVGASPEDFRAALELLPRLDVAALTRTTLPLARFRDAWNVHRNRGDVNVILEVEQA